MAFDFGSDILVDAMQAADPQLAADARMKLQQISAMQRAGEVSSSTFNDSLSAADQRIATKDSPREVLQKFESVVLSTFVQAMMPKDAESVFGEGLSGDMWKAQMAEKIGEQMAKNGALGLADRLLKSYQTDGENIEPISGLHDPALAVPQTRAQDGAVQFVQQLERDILIGNDDESTPASLVLNPNMEKV
ncbi:MAG: rod-binding protein [Rhizobiaceae bacterium]